jgi:hypothetical protein
VICFGIRCLQCSTACAQELKTAEQVRLAKEDPVLGLKSFSKEKQKELMDYYFEHSEKGHDVEPLIMEVLPIAEA